MIKEEILKNLGIEASLNFGIAQTKKDKNLKKL